MDYGPGVHNEVIPGTLDLGLYHSKGKNEWQVAKVPQKDRATHLYVVGATGTGKTKFLQSLIYQDIANSNGFGVIDPHGDLIEDIKGFLACRYFRLADQEEIADRVVLVDPTDPVNTVAFNPLEKMPGVSVAEQAGELVSSFRKIWADSWGTRMEDLMRNSLIALGEAELTLCELTSFLTRRSFREAVLQRVTNPIALDYFRRFNTLTDRGQTTWIEPVMNKINAFLADDRMRQMFASPQSSFRLREVMDGSRFLLVKLDKGKLKGASDLLGSLLMAKIQMTAFSRSDIPAHRRIPFHLYIDEFQNFASDSFEVILSEARKYGLSLVMAHQSLSQIPDSLRGLILSSAGLQVFFRVNRHDAQLLAKETFSYSGYEVKSEGKTSPVYWSYAEEWEHRTADLQQLAPRACYVKHKTQGGAIELRTVGIPTPWEELEMSEEEYQGFLATVPFGSKHLRSRAELAAEARERLKSVAQETEAISPIGTEPLAVADSHGTPVESSSVAATASARTTVAPPANVPEPKAAPQSDPVAQREHRRLQHLIKRLAEPCGYRATIEQPTEDGQGRVDVALVRDDERIACEVSVTTSPEHEMENIRKCLSSGFARVILCATQRRTLEKTRALGSRELPESEQRKISYLEPGELVFLLEEEAARCAGRVERVKGYKVKVNFQPIEETEKQTKRQAIAQVLSQSLKREKQTSPDP